MQEGRHELAGAFLDDLRRIDAQLRDTNKKLTVMVAAAGTILFSATASKSWKGAVRGGYEILVLTVRHPYCMYVH